MGKVSGHELVCNKVRGGKTPLWNCRHISHYAGSMHEITRITGAANTADNAIRDWRKQFRKSGIVNDIDW